VGKPAVSIVMGSDSDLTLMEEAGKVLQDFGIQYEVVITSAHRSPKRTHLFVSGLIRRGIRVVIAGAGGAAHLAGTIAAQTILPVIGVPIPSSSLNGLDSLLSTVQMPSGVPVGTVGIGKAGVINAGLLAVQILALTSSTLSAKFTRYKQSLEKGVALKAQKIERKASKR
jgi:phosphoribosylaminoimidazole carboxylase PurE protein